MNNSSWVERQDACQLADVLAQDIARHLQQRIDQRGRAVVAFSGGSTPIPLFQALCRCELDWRSVIITLVDERWVPEDHPLSNAGLLRSHLLSALPSTKFVSLYEPANSAQESLAKVLANYAQSTASSVSSPAPFDAVVLGMGGDGHTASFFPDAENIAELVNLESDALLETCESPSTQVPRITWSLPALLSASFLALHFTSEAKRAVFEQAQQSGEFTELPIRAFIHQQQKVLTTYFAP